MQPQAKKDVSGRKKAKESPVKENDPNPVVTEFEVMSPFKDLFQSRLAKCLRDQFGKGIVPLSMVGLFLNFVGNNLLWNIS